MMNPMTILGMNSVRRHSGESSCWARTFLLCAVGALATGCSGVAFTGARPLPGNGPNGSDVRSSSQVAVGLPPTPNTPMVYPLTARISHTDQYHGVSVDDPYRWMEDLDSEQVRHWVDSENQISRPRLEKIPHRAWVKQRLTALWNYERFGVPAKHGGHYFFLHNDGKQNQSVLFVSDSLESPGRVLFDPNSVREDATVALADYTPNHA